MTTPKPYEQVNEDKKPWLTVDGFQKTFFPSSWGKANSYTLFTPSVDRFIITDHFDLWTMVESAKILTSKMSPIIYILNRPSPKELTNATCLEYTTCHKKFEPEFGSPAVARHKQSASLKKIQPDTIIHAGWPADYSKPDRADALRRLQEYSLFTLRCVYAINLAWEFRNNFAEQSYVDSFFKDEFPKSFKTLHDTTSAPHGMKHEIKNILYHSMTVDEALSGIHAAWLKYSSKDISGVRQNFYFILGIVEPEVTRMIGKPGEWNKDYHESTAWVM